MFKSLTSAKFFMIAKMHYDCNGLVFSDQRENTVWFIAVIYMVLMLKFCFSQPPHFFIGKKKKKNKGKVTATVIWLGKWALILLSLPLVKHRCVSPLGFPHSSVGKSSACNAGDLGSVPGLGRSPGEGNSNPLQYSCLENPMDRGVWQATSTGSQELDTT